MNEAEAKKLDDELLEALDIDPYVKISTSLVLVIHRQLLALSAESGIAIEKMDREFIVESLAKVKPNTERAS